ncbi:uncharacterized protein LOC115994555 [Quercus lobata]|uniref:uncharacterized protein LOC115994555 n=1 Tax=Quercus lobata TaxID=97700 RepID=UPI001244BBAD|nr:uncharacterized protein LOC115994555 [Quercus lobata]
MEGNYDESKVTMAAIIAWAIWSNRNEVCNGGRVVHGSGRWTTRYLKEYYAANEQLAIVPTAQITNWIPPPTNRYKINVDGVVFKSQKIAGVGVMVRDCCGQVIAALSKKINVPLGPLETEAKAVEVGVQFARDIGIQDCIIEGDSLTIYTALYGNTSPPSTVAVVVSSIKVLCGAIRGVEFSHTQRQCNRPAHLLAK